MLPRKSSLQFKEIIQTKSIWIDILDWFEEKKSKSISVKCISFFWVNFELFVSTLVVVVEKYYFCLKLF